MTDLEYALLVKVRDNQPYNEDLLSRNETLIISECHRKKWIHITQKGNIVLTSRGEAAMLEHEYALKNKAKKQAEEEREHVRSRSLQHAEQANANRLSWIQVFAPMLVDAARGLLNRLIH